MAATTLPPTRAHSRGSPSLGGGDVVDVLLADPEYQALLLLLHSLGLLERALGQRDTGLLEAYGDGLALIEPAFTLADAGVGRIYALPVGFVSRLKAHERQLARLRE